MRAKETGVVLLQTVVLKLHGIFKHMLDENLTQMYHKEFYSEVMVELN